MGKRYYAVVKGKTPGIYTDYKIVREQIKGYPSQHKGFNTKEEAIQYYEQYKTAPLTNKKGKYYAVKIGRQPGVYRTWTECLDQTKGYPCAQFKSFVTEEEAVDFIQENDIGTAIEGDAAIVFTDGSCLDNVNGKFVGYSCWFGENDARNYYDGQLIGTNNIGELKAVIKALEIMKHTGNIIVYTDSTYVMQGLNSYKLMIQNGMADQSLPSDLKNRDLWVELLNSLYKHDGQFSIKKVEAHVGIHGNEMADQMAKAGAMLYRTSIH